MQSRMGMPQTGYDHDRHHQNGMGHMMNPNLDMSMGGMRPQMQKQDSKKAGQRKPTAPGEKKSNAPKSPAVKRVKEVVFVKLFVVQQQYKPTEKPIIEDVDVGDEDIPPVEGMDEEEKPEGEEEPKEEEEPKPEEAEQQIEEESHQEPDQRPDSEEHLSYENSEKAEEEESVELYDSNQTKSVDVNSKNKATSLKKIILESIGLFKKASIVLLKL